MKLGAISKEIIKLGAISKEIRIKGTVMRNCVSILLLSLVWVSALSAAAIETITLTPKGPDTVILMTGTFGPEIHTTAYSAPNTPYQVSFEVPTAPTEFNVFPEFFVFSISNIFATLNGVTFPGSGAGFYSADNGGGLSVCLGISCDEGIVKVLQFDTYGDTLFTGDYTTNPVFKSGSIFVDTTQGAISEPTPEPASIAFAGLGFAIGALLKFKRLKGAV